MRYYGTKPHYANITQKLFLKANLSLVPPIFESLKNIWSKSYGAWKRPNASLIDQLLWHEAKSSCNFMINFSHDAESWFWSNNNQSAARFQEKWRSKAIASLMQTIMLTNHVGRKESLVGPSFASNNNNQLMFAFNDSMRKQLSELFCLINFQINVI